MHCIVISSPQGKRFWSVHRSTELIAYHQGRNERYGCVQIVVALLAINKLKGQPNTMRFMHRGNVVPSLMRSWPLPHHPDEDKKNAVSLLKDIYGRTFEEAGGRVIRRNALTPWDSWDLLQSSDEVRTWPPATNGPGGLNRWLRKLGPDVDHSKYTPFTKWEIGPFDQAGLHLIAFSLAFSGETYTKLVGEDGPFTVDGPRRVISRIIHGDLTTLSDVDRDEHMDGLADFTDPERRLSSASYDIVLLGPPAANCDTVHVCENLCANGIYAAPRQPQREGVRRLLARDQCFTISLNYGEQVTQAQHSLTTACSS